LRASSMVGLDINDGRIGSRLISVIVGSRHGVKSSNITTSSLPTIAARWGRLSPANAMEPRQIESDSGLLASIDFRAFFETVRLRWWVIPLVVAMSIGIFVAQESRLRTEPPSYRVSKSFQIPNPKAVLSGAGINPGLIEEFPDSIAQLLILRSDDVRREIGAQLGREIPVEVPTTYEMPFVLSCNQTLKADCERAIAAYAKKAEEVRRDAIAAGLEALKEVLVGVQAVKNDATTSAKIAAIDALMKNINTELVQIDSFEQSVGPTVTRVQRTKYVFGLAAGLLVSLLILLQLTYTDSRVRSVRQLVRLVGRDTYLGSLTTKSDTVRDRRTALALFHGSGRTKGAQLRYVPLRSELEDLSSVARLTEMTGATHVVSKPFSELSVPELIQGSSNESDVLVVQRNRDSRNDVLEAHAALRRSGRRLAGVILLG